MTAQAALQHLENIVVDLIKIDSITRRLTLDDVVSDDARQNADENNKRTDTLINLLIKLIPHFDRLAMLISITDPSIVYSFLYRYYKVSRYLSTIPAGTPLSLPSDNLLFFKQTMIDLYYEVIKQE